ncbi:MAG: xanthine dehydrogenase family protein subunit [Spirosoma sp.]|nr:xanthine dehydrogenase family protein subunit [Spirosoma sp.]
MIGIKLAYKAPETLKEALDLIGREGHQVLTADQALVNGLKKGTSSSSLHTLVSLRKIPGLATIDYENNELRLGTSITYTDLLNHQALAHYPVLAQALATIPDPHLRHHSTVGGALYHGGPVHAPVIAALMALDATAVVLTRDKETRLPLQYFSQSGLRVLLPLGGLLSAIVIPNTSLNASTYLSLNQLSGRQRNYGIAACVAQSDQTIDQIRLVLAGFTEQPIQLKRVEEALLGKTLTADSIKMVAIEQLEQVKLPFQDGSLPEGYQRHLAGVALNRALTSLAKKTTQAVS